MSKYHVAEAVGRFFILMDTNDNKYSPHFYFNGYDAMGSVNWEDRFSFNYALETREEAEQIVKDLEAGEEIDAEDAKVLKDHPNWLCFKGIYDNGSNPAGSAFFDLENLIADIRVYLHYDEQHCEIIRKAMLAYSEQK